VYASGLRDLKWHPFITEFSYANKNKTHADVPTGLFFSHIITVVECHVGTLSSCKIYLLNDRHGLSLYGGTQKSAINKYVCK